MQGMQRYGGGDPTPQQLLGRYDRVERLQDALDQLSQDAHLVLPAGGMAIPDGHSVVVSAVWISTDETYPVSRGRNARVALSKSALNKIGAAAGLSWLDSRRTDDGADPHYCAWTVTAQVTDPDGTSRRIPGSVEIDLRDGAEEAQALLSQGKTPSTGAALLAQTRRFIARHAESKAMNRAIRAALAMKTTFEPGEFDRPFVAAKVIFTGAFDDPEVRRMAQMAAIAKHNGAVAALFGGSPAPMALPIEPATPTHDTVASPAPPVNRPTTSEAPWPSPAPLPPSTGPGASPLPSSAPPPNLGGDVPSYPASALEIEVLCRLARAKGRLGQRRDQMTWAGIRDLSPRGRARLRAKLEAMPDTTPAPAAAPFLGPDDGDDPIPF